MQRMRRGWSLLVVSINANGRQRTTDHKERGQYRHQLCREASNMKPSARPHVKLMLESGNKEAKILVAESILRFLV